MKKIFITGICGFIGYHLAQRLKQLGHDVIGIDNFNSYYEPELKRSRQGFLEKLGVCITEGNICNTKLLKQLFKEHDITDCVHLAAQAGVRYSLTNPSEYVSANLVGFSSVLEACRIKKGLKLTFASSSSIYGLNSKIPFSESDPTEHPSNFYGATKKANEAMAFSYHHLYDIPMVGLRYFTVYGPWGRPDMAYFHFTRCILENKPIQLYNNGKMKRDFTYIDDIIEGTVSAMLADTSFEIFNLGGCQPVGLFDFIETLETVLNKPAIKELFPVQPGEVLETYADISKAKSMLNFQPQTTLEEGLRKFTNWYLEYYSKQNDYHTKEFIAR